MNYEKNPCPQQFFHQQLQIHLSDLSQRGPLELDGNFSQNICTTSFPQKNPRDLPIFLQKIKKYTPKKLTAKSPLIGQVDHFLTHQMADLHVLSHVFLLLPGEPRSPEIQFSICGTNQPNRRERSKRCWSVCEYAKENQGILKQKTDCIL